MDRIANERRQSGYLKPQKNKQRTRSQGTSRTHIANIKTESFTTNRLQDIVKDGLLHKRQVDQLYMREIRHELHADLHVSGEHHVFEQNGHRCTSQTLANADAENDLGVDLVQLLLLLVLVEDYFGQMK